MTEEELIESAAKAVFISYYGKNNLKYIWVHLKDFFIRDARYSYDTIRTVSNTKLTDSEIVECAARSFFWEHYSAADPVEAERGWSYYKEMYVNDAEIVYLIVKSAVNSGEFSFYTVKE